MSNAPLDPAALREILRRPFPVFVTRRGRTVLVRSASVFVLLPPSDDPYELVRFLLDSPPEVARDFRIALLRRRVSETTVVDLVELEAFLRDLP